MKFALYQSQREIHTVAARAALGDLGLKSHPKDVCLLFHLHPCGLSDEAGDGGGYKTLVRLDRGVCMDSGIRSPGPSPDTREQGAELSRNLPQVVSLLFRH